MAKMVLEIENEMNATQMTDVYQTSSVGAHRTAQKMAELFDALCAGGQNGVLNIKVGAVQAAVNGTFTGAPTANDTIVINGVTLTAIANAGTPTNVQFKIGTTATTAAQNLVACVNACTSAGILDVVFASNLAGVVTFTSKQAGKVGNAIVLSESLGNFTLAATVMSGGTHASGSNITHQFGKAPTTTY